MPRKKRDGLFTFLEKFHPEKILGPHITDDGYYRIASVLPRAQKAWLEFKETGSIVPMEEREGKIFSANIPEEDYSEGSYLVCFEDSSSYIEKREDPYSFPTKLTDYDIYLFKKGELIRSYERMGAHRDAVRGVQGIRFTLWAPGARSVSVIGNFSHWIRDSYPMINVRDSGIWELFVPELSEGELYKFSIETQDGEYVEKSDPYGFRTELRPRTASIVHGLDYEWGDDTWMKKRVEGDVIHEPVSVYEVHLGSWRKPSDDPNSFINYSDLTGTLIPYVKDLGYSHIELMPVMEHPLDASWGYQVLNYYSATSRYGTPQELMHFIDECHRNGLGVILDWVPAHFPRDDSGLSNFDGTHLFEYDDPRKGVQPDWGTMVFDFGKGGVRSFLISNAIFWLEHYHADGIRIDAVSSMLYLDYSRKEGEWAPNVFGGRENLEAIDFIRNLNRWIHEDFPGVITVAEESTAWGGVTKPYYEGGLGFDLKWNMGWMHDTLYYFSRDPVYRRYDHSVLTFSAWYAFSENFILPFSHDEVVHMKGSMMNKMPGDQWRKFANLRLLYTYMTGSPGKKLLFMGDEFGQENEWNENESLQWDLLNRDMNGKLLLMVKDLNRMYRKYPQMYQNDCDPAGFSWIDFHDTENSVISFYRYSADHKRSAIFIFNMTPVPRSNYRIGVDSPGRYLEIFNSDAREYGGTGTGNLGGVTASDEQAHGRNHSLVLTLPPLAGEVFIHEGEA